MIPTREGYYWTTIPGAPPVPVHVFQKGGALWVERFGHQPIPLSTFLVAAGRMWEVMEQPKTVAFAPLKTSLMPDPIGDTIRNLYDIKRVLLHNIPQSPDTENERLILSQDRRRGPADRRTTANGNFNEKAPRH